jgi:hypothetical protein
MLFVSRGFQESGHGQRLHMLTGVNQDGAVGAGGHRGAQSFLALGYAGQDLDDFNGFASSLEANGFIDGEFVERIHRHSAVGNIHARSVRFEAYADVVVHHALDQNQNFMLIDDKMELMISNIPTECRKTQIARPYAPGTNELPRFL